MVIAPKEIGREQTKNSLNQSRGDCLLLAHSPYLSDRDRLHASKLAQRLGFTIDLRPFHDMDVQASYLLKDDNLIHADICERGYMRMASSIRCSPKVWDDLSYSRWAATSATWTWSAPWRRSSDCRRKPVLWGKKTSSSRLVYPTRHIQIWDWCSFCTCMQLGRV